MLINRNDNDSRVEVTAKKAGALMIGNSFVSILFTLVGAVFGYWVGQFAGIVWGILIALLVVWIRHLSERVASLEASRAVADRIRTRTPSNPKAGNAPPQPDAAPESPTPNTSPPTPEPSPVPPRPSTEDSIRAPRTAPRSNTVTTDPTLVAPDRAINTVKGWLTSGNVPVRVGVVLSLLGLAFFIREAIDRQLFNLPIEFRLMGVALFGLGLLALGWRLRGRRRAYALSLQGGGIAVLYLTAYSAFALFDLLPAPPVFGFLLIFTAAGVTLAVLQNSRTLAVLGIAGGFMAPVLASTGESDHVLLFGYFAILNTAVVAIAWFKAWRSLNLLGFVFTFAIGGLWGYQGYRAEHFATTEPFLILFMLVYMIIPVLFAHRNAPNLRGFADGTLVFGTPVVGFGLQTRLVGDTEYGLAISAVVLAALYVSVSAFIHRRLKDLRVLMEAFFGLAAIFLAIAVPLALDARGTSVAWVLQGAGLVWLGCRQQRRLALAAGFAMQLLAGLAYAIQSGTYSADSLPLLNGFALGAALVALAGGISVWWLDRDNARGAENPVPKSARWLLLGWSAAWWLWAGLAEIAHFLSPPHSLAAGLVFVAMTTVAAALGAARCNWPRLNAVGLLLAPAMAIAFVMALENRSHPFAGFGWLAWSFALAAYYALLRYREDRFARIIVGLHTWAYWTLATLAASEAYWWIDRIGGGVWPTAGALSAVAAFLFATLRARKVVQWPLARHWDAYAGICAGTVALALGVAVLATNLWSPGDPSPLPYVPLLNPLALATLFSALVVWRWHLVTPWRWPGNRFATPAVAVASLYLLTMAVARAVHHWLGVPFAAKALVDSVVLQSSLSIVWGSVALLGMVLGARRQRRAVWVGGAILMAVVVVKLFAVDLANTGDFARVVSFLGVGLLLLVVGYFAPVPPRNEAEANTSHQ